MTALSQDVEADLRRENARLQAELRAAHDRQAGSAEILRTIGSASGDAEQSLYQIAETTKRLFEASSVTILVAGGGEWRQIVHDGASSKRIGAEVPVAQLRIGGHSMPGATFSENRQIHLPDIDNVDAAIADWPGLRPARAAGTRTICGTPLRLAGQPVGVLIVHRDRLAPFSAEELSLLQNFADQAAIAIENARLFNESREALDRQDASADILRTIASSPGDAGRSLQQIAETSARLFGAPSVSLQLAEDGEWGQAYRFGDSAQRVRSAVPLADIRIGGRNLPGTVVAENRQIHIPDLDHLDPSMADWPGPPHARAAGTRTMCGTPLRREGKAIGVLIIYRDRLLPFTPEELALQQSFADQAVIAIENARLFNETQEALARQTATSDILRVISQSLTDVQPVFDEIVLTAARLLRCDSFILNHDGATYWCAAMASPQGPHPILAAEKVTIDPDANFPSRAIVGKKNLHVPDWSVIDLPDYERGIREMYGINSALYLPLLREGECIGVLGLARKQAGMLGESEIALAESFRDQAVIAIQNARLFNETREALERQTATADILKVIASSPSDVQPVFEAIAASANRLLGGFSCTVVRFIDGTAHLKAFTPTTQEADEVLQSSFPQPVAGFVPFQSAQAGEVTQVSDTEAMTGGILDISRARGFRSMLFVPLVNKGEPIGTIGVTRVQPGNFADRHVQLLKTFADQAVIAIENARLFNETKEALTYQTGSSNILGVIASSPTDVGPVLKAIVESACELCEADDALVVLKDGKDLVFKEQHGSIPVVWQAQPVSRDWVAGRAVVDRKPIHVHDLLSTEGEQFPDAQAFAHQTGVRTVLGVPLLRKNESIGSIVLRRTEVQPFSDKQIALLQTFADQAVIAIGNVRLFEEVQARTKELSRSLEDLRTAQDRLVQTEKLASLGHLTAGIAHEIKNPLNFVNNFAALSSELTDELNEVLLPAPLDRKTREEVDEITQTLKDNLSKVVQHGKRADSIVKNMLLHSREGSGDHRPADINALLDESLNLAYHGARAEKREFNVTLQRDFDEEAGTIEVFPQEITRVFLNLISNGFYAVTKRKLENGSSGFDPVVRATTKSFGDTVEIRIHDNGTGIPAEVKEKMFNPFFTTKPAGEGTGLGLSMSHDIIVKQHGGTIDVATEPGVFTEFRIVLPRSNNLSSKNGTQ
jgi:two-component system, NtrC family, sensor kinase